MPVPEPWEPTKVTPVQRWLVGDDTDISWFRPWLSMMRE